MDSTSFCPELHNFINDSRFSEQFRERMVGGMFTITFLLAVYVDNVNKPGDLFSNALLWE